MPGRTHSREFKLNIVNQVNGGQKTTAHLCREHSLSPSLIHRGAQGGRSSWGSGLHRRGQSRPVAGTTQC
ncbi:transposase [Deinococcus sp. YIM 134068]|uniref:transposase n=1 Tax=Deinococcus lichenicola TaxID=3118910 RepID=UPI003FA481C5